MKNFLLLLSAFIVSVNLSAQDLNFNSASPTWAPATLTNTYTNTGSPAISTINAAYTGDVANFSGTTFPRPSSAGLRTQMNFSENTQKVVFTVTFSNAVTGLAFNIAEIDKATNNTSYIDRVIVTGFYGNTAVLPTFPLVSQFASASGNVITGTSQDGATTPTSVYFEGNVDRIVIEYDNAPGADANPSNQEINIGNMSWSGALPVRLVRFDAQNDNGKAKLEWVTSREQNSDHFGIQKTKDFVDIQEVGSVKAEGNSETDKNYTWTDEAVLAGLTYYRLKQVDLDGSTVMSKWVSVKNDELSLNLYPNPVIEGFYVDSPAKVAHVYLVDLTGKTLKIFPSQKYYNGLGQYPPGIYGIKIGMEDGTLIYRKIIK